METVDGVGTTHYTYDSVGSITVISNPVSQIAYQYDFAGRVTNLVSSGSLLPAPCTLQFGYDAAGRMTKLTYPDGKTVSYAYYTNSLLKTVTDWGTRVTAYEYYPDGRLSKITRPNGTIRTQAYALDGRLSRVEERTADGHLIALYQYNYNANGTLESRFSLPSPQPYKLPAQEFTYDNDNRIATHNGAAVTYDADGNLLSDPTNASEPTNFIYNARNFLTSTAGGSNSTSTVYSYDVAGNRIAQTTINQQLTTNTTTYVVNPNSSLSQVLVREKNGQKTFYVYGLGLEYEVSQSGEVRYYHYDQIGSTVALSDGAGQVTDRIEYSPYGTVTHRTGTNDTPFLYVGQYGVQTDDNGLLYMRARYYSPILRRFLNSDPIGFGGGLNFFAYANGNPFGSIDPSGCRPGPLMTFFLPAHAAMGSTAASFSIEERRAYINYANDIGQFKVNTIAAIDGIGAGILALPAAPLMYEAAAPSVAWWSTDTIIKAQMLAGGVASMVNNRTAQFFLNNQNWAFTAYEAAVDWLDSSSVSKLQMAYNFGYSLGEGLDQAGRFAWDKFTDHFGASKSGVDGQYGPRVEFIDDLKSGSDAMNGNVQANNSLEAQSTTTPVSGAGGTPKP